MDSSNSPVAVIVAGGTGGHLYPGIASARELARRSSGAGPWKAVFIVRQGDRGRDLLQREGFDVIELPGQGFPRRLSWRLFTFPFSLGAGFLKACGVLNRLKPAVVVGMGGYLSFPVLIAARLKGIPTLIHEQNVYPGLTNRLLSRCVRSVAVSFADGGTVFPPAKIVRTGLPVRSEIGTLPQADARKRLNLADNKLTFLIFGGSQGAHRMNASVAAAWPRVSEWYDAFQVLHVTGERDFAGIRDLYRAMPVKATVIPYCHEMPAALAAATLVICRAGASTIAELIVAQKPALLVPFPFASENHQFYNAEVLVKRGAADWIPDAEFTPENAADRLRRYLQRPERMDEMRLRMTTLSQEEPHALAAQRLADLIAHTR